ncbi:hypothetical protein [Sinomicrobium sp. M5D2P17]
MIDEENILHYTTSIEMVLKELRKEKGISQGKEKGLSQSDVNIDFAQKYKFNINMGRFESTPNFGMITLKYLCDYFGISIADFFERVMSKKEDEIVEFLKEKERKRKEREKAKERKKSEKDKSKNK